MYIHMYMWYHSYLQGTQYINANCLLWFRLTFHQKLLDSLASNEWSCPWNEKSQLVLQVLPVTKCTQLSLVPTLLSSSCAMITICYTLPCITSQSGLCMRMREMGTSINDPLPIAMSMVIFWTRQKHRGWSGWVDRVDSHPPFTCSFIQDTMGIGVSLL